MSDQDTQVGGLGDPALPAKPIWQSRTIIGAAVTIAALVAGFYKIKIDVGNLTDILVQIAGLVGSALVIYGRIKATQPIRLPGRTVPGGAFKPQAEVRKAEKAFIRWPALLALLGCIAIWTGVSLLVFHFFIQ